MMAKDRQQRYQTPGEAAEALASLLSGASAASGRLPPTTGLPPLPASPSWPVAESPSTDGVVPPRPAVASDPGRPSAKQLAGLIGWALLVMLGIVAAVVVPSLLRDRGPLNEKGENSIGMRFAKIPKGKFWMGSREPIQVRPEFWTARSDDAKPCHEVEISRDFYLGVHEVTQKQYKTIMGKNPSCFSAEGQAKDMVKGLDTDDFPVECVTWEDTQEFLNRLNEREKKTLNGWVYRLPTEAEWEYACRGGVDDQRYHFGDSLSPQQANFSDTGLKRTEKVGSYPANRYGLHDMHGNVAEWCLDWYAWNFYMNSPRRNPLNVKQGSGGPHGGFAAGRVCRGGSWFHSAVICRTAFRTWGRRDRDLPLAAGGEVGFRVALVPAR
jgi:formylglycine-generating enzyme required for sulfatase activity